MNSSGKPRVFLVDDHALVRSGVRAELTGHMEVIGEADEVEAAVEMIVERRPDVVLLDVHLPGGGGLAVMEGAKEAGSEAAFLALSVSDAAEDVVALIRAGARGYVTKSISGPELVDAVGRVAGGDAVFSPRLAGFVLEAFAGDGPEERPPGRGTQALDPELDLLTPREGEVLRLIARGYTYKEIAREMTISSKTVESHMSGVLRKLQLSNRYQLTYWAAQRKLL